jgi:hypothetical protein
MKLALETMLTLQRESLLQRFAIGGAIAASFYVEAIATEDLDISLAAMLLLLCNWVEQRNITALML